MKSAKDKLKSFSWIYIIASVILAAGVAICNFIPELYNPINEKLTTDGINGIIIFDITAGLVVLSNLWYFWLNSRVAAGKSKGTFLLILLVLGVVGSIYTFFTTPGVSRSIGFDSIVDLFGLYYLLEVRKENSK